MRKDVIDFTNKMNVIMEEKQQTRSWYYDDPDSAVSSVQLVDLAHTHLDKLLLALRHNDKIRISRECVHVANFMMMANQTYFGRGR